MAPTCGTYHKAMYLGMYAYLAFLKASALAGYYRLDIGLPETYVWIETAGKTVL